MDNYVTTTTIVRDFMCIISQHAYAHVQVAIPQGQREFQIRVASNCLVHTFMDNTPCSSGVGRVAITALSIRHAHTELTYPCSITVRGLPPSYKTVGGDLVHVLLPAGAANWEMADCYTTNIPRILLQQYDVLDIESLMHENTRVDPHNGDYCNVRADSPLDLLCTLDKEYSRPRDVVAMDGFRLFETELVLRAQRALMEYTQSPLADLANLYLDARIFDNVDSDAQVEDGAGAGAGASPAVGSGMSTPAGAKDVGQRLAFEIHIDFIPIPDLREFPQDGGASTDGQESDGYAGGVSPPPTADPENSPAAPFTTGASPAHLDGVVVDAGALESGNVMRRG